MGLFEKIKRKASVFFSQFNKKESSPKALWDDESTSSRRCYDVEVVSPSGQLVKGHATESSDGFRVVSWVEPPVSKKAVKNFSEPQKEKHKTRKKSKYYCSKCSVEVSVLANYCLSCGKKFCIRHYEKKEHDCVPRAPSSGLESPKFFDKVLTKPEWEAIRLAAPRLMRFTNEHLEVCGLIEMDGSISNAKVGDIDHVRPDIFPSERWKGVFFHTHPRGQTAIPSRADFRFAEYLYSAGAKNITAHIVASELGFSSYFAGKPHVFYHWNEI